MKVKGVRTHRQVVFKHSEFASARQGVDHMHFDQMLFGLSGALIRLETHIKCTVLLITSGLGDHVAIVHETKNMEIHQVYTLNEAADWRLFLFLFGRESSSQIPYARCALSGIIHDDGVADREPCDIPRLYQGFEGNFEAFFLSALASTSDALP